MKLKLSEWLLCIAVCVLVVTVMFADMASVQRVGAALAAVGLVWEGLSSRRRSAVAAKTSGKAAKKARAAAQALQVRWPAVTLLAPLLLWFVWTTMFQVGAGLSDAGTHAWLTRVVFPLVGFFACYRLALIQREPVVQASPLKVTSTAPVDADVDRPRYATYVEAACWLAVLGLAVIGVIDWLRPSALSGAIGRLDDWHDANHASTLAVIVMPLFIAMISRASTRLAGGSGLILALVIGLTQSPGYFGLAAVLVLLVAAWPYLRRHRLALGVAVLLVLIVMAVMTFYSNSVPVQRDVGTTMASHANHWTMWGRSIDLTPWREWLSSMPRSDTHPHMLHALLRSGVMGMLLQCAVLIALLLCFCRASPGDPWLRSGGAALVLGIICKSVTDDIVWQAGIMLAFHAHAGWLLGRSDLSAAVARKASSGRSVAMRRLRRVGN